jgi:hypothetical protein
MIVPSFVAVYLCCLLGLDSVSGAAVEPPLSEPNVNAVDYNHNGDALQGFVATPSSSSDGPFPAVVIIPYVYFHFVFKRFFFQWDCYIAHTLTHSFTVSNDISPHNYI